MRICPKCRGNVPREIKINGLRKDLKGRKYCLNCSPLTVSRKIPSERQTFNENAQKYQHSKGFKRKRELVILKGGKCIICGYDKNLAVLSFHHRDPAQKQINLTRREMVGTKFEKLLLEIEKCDLLCCNCHFEKHHPKYDNWQ